MTINKSFWPTHRFEITVNDFLSVEDLQALQDGVRETADERNRETVEMVLLDQLIQVHTET